MKKLILFIGLLLFAFLNVCAQKEYQIEQVSAINMGCLLYTSDAADE